MLSLEIWHGFFRLETLTRKQTDEVLERLQGMGESAYHIGWVEAREGDAEAVQFVD